MKRLFYAIFLLGACIFVLAVTDKYDTVYDLFANKDIPLAEPQAGASAPEKASPVGMLPKIDTEAKHRDALAPIDNKSFLRSETELTLPKIERSSPTPKSNTQNADGKFSYTGVADAAPKPADGTENTHPPVHQQAAPQQHSKAPAAQSAKQAEKDSAPKQQEAPARAPTLDELYGEQMKLWKMDKTTHFNLYREKTVGLGTAGLDLILEQLYQKMSLSVSWMGKAKTNVFFYNNKSNYVRGQFQPPAWSRAVFLGSIDTIVFYDIPGDTDKVKQDFMHEYMHMINELYFNPENAENNSAPIWLDEGIAVNMEDIALSAKGGYWNEDIKTLNILSHGDKLAAAKGGSSSFGIQRSVAAAGRPVYFMSFAEFIRPDSLEKAEAADNVQYWYLQAYAMVRFLWTPELKWEKQMTFEKFVDSIAGQNRVSKKRAKKMSDRDALKSVYGYETMTDFETAFWSWMRDQKKKSYKEVKNKSAQQQTGPTQTMKSAATSYTTSFSYPGK
ncbi:hypothetical protein Dip518_000583 [Parelusimicrobium proximum]|uniref:hypothetical protein n=1 Tax=Parelusimicrobium proximum TaxID=3228953 RepID=UPI003D1796A2